VAVALWFVPNGAQTPEPQYIVKSIQFPVTVFRSAWQIKVGTPIMTIRQMKIKVFDIVSARFFIVYPFPKTRITELKIKITWGGVQKWLQKWLQICAIFISFNNTQNRSNKINRLKYKMNLQNN
jgi:hypothetical protein